MADDDDLINIGDDGWDDDDEMADLFSFGTDPPPKSEENGGGGTSSGGGSNDPSAVGGGDPSTTPSSDLDLLLDTTTASNTDLNSDGLVANALKSPGTAAADELFGPSMVKSGSNDSLIDMLDEKGDVFTRERGFTQEEDEIDFDSESSSSDQAGGGGSTGKKTEEEEQQDILDWLDDKEPAPTTNKEETSGSNGSAEAKTSKGKTTEEQPKPTTVIGSTAATSVKETEKEVNPVESTSAAAPPTKDDSEKNNDGQTTTATEKSASGDSDDDKAPSSTTDSKKEENASDETSEKSTEKQEPPEPEAPPTFETLADAIQSPKATGAQICDLFIKEGFKVSAKFRPHLWCRAVCGKTLNEVMESSVADSFIEWDTNFYNMEISAADNDDNIKWITNEANILAERIVSGTTPDDSNEPGVTLEEAKRSLCAVLLYHWKSQQSSMNSESLSSIPQHDPLIPPVACALLSAGLPTAGASVVLSQIMPQFMPLLALSHQERAVAAKTLHTKFYLLACYHLPLLVFHLDRYAPGWHWPKQIDNENDENDNSSPKKNSNASATHKGRHLELQGVVPESWLISHLAGECGGAFMNPKWLNSLWDLILVSSNNSLRFFLALAVLEKDSDTLLMLTGDKLIEELNRIMEFKEGTTLEGFAIEAEEDGLESEAVDWVQEWCDRARSLWESTPRSVVGQLRAAEDGAVNLALQQRQKDAEEKLQARLEAEAKAHREAVEAEKERRLQEARDRLTRARLVAFYRKFNPEREENVDKILVTFAGRLDVLDKKLKTKYGVGFNPALPPKKNKINEDTKKLLSNMGNNTTNFFKNKSNKSQQQQGGEDGRTTMKETNHQANEVTVTVSPAEVLPVLCWSKEGAAKAMNMRGRYSGQKIMPLKFYLVDSRPEDTAAEQGRFPTAVTMSPDTLMDPEKMQLHEDMFESLRGAVHVVVMGEGFDALPTLYGNKLTPKLQTLMQEDDSRTSNCALFFAKKGFPFVSILDGGFAAAHAWLSREGHRRHLRPSSVLVDYNPQVSMFAQLEEAYKAQVRFANATTTEKTQRALQNFVDGSMTSLTRNKIRLERLAANIDTKEGTKKVGESVSKYFAKSSLSPTNKSTTNFGSSSEGKNPLAGLRSKVETLKAKREDSGDGMQPKKENPLAGLRNKVESLKRKEDGAGALGDLSTKPNPLAGLRNKVESLKKKDTDVSTAAKESGKGADLSSDNKSTSGANTGSSDNAAPLFKNPFANPKVGTAGNETSAPGTNVPSALQQNLAKLKQAAVSTINQAEEYQRDAYIDEQEPTGAPKKKIGFGGLGASYKSAAGSFSIGKGDQTRQVPEVLKKNPFARFGANNNNNNSQGRGGGGNKGPKVNRFAGLGTSMNQMRLNATNAAKARVQAKGSNDEEEFSISFN